VSAQKACKGKRGIHQETGVSFEMHCVVLLGKDLKRPQLVWYLSPFERSTSFFYKVPSFCFLVLGLVLCVRVCVWFLLLLFFFHDLVLLDFLLFTLYFWVFNVKRAQPSDNTVLFNTSGCNIYAGTNLEIRMPDYRSGCVCFVKQLRRLQWWIPSILCNSRNPLNKVLHEEHSSMKSQGQIFTAFYFLQIFAPI